LKKVVIELLKYGCSLAIIAWLVWDAQRNDTFSELWTRPKDWGMLAAGWALCMLGVVITFFRWYVLVRALGLPFSLKDAFRLGFLGYLMNFFSLGSVGGDLFKAIFLAREHRGRRPEAVATVVIDRIVGLYAMCLLAAVMMYLTGLMDSSVREIRMVGKAAVICTLVGTIGLTLVLTPGFTNGALSEFLARLPRVGPIIAKLMGAIRIYRRKLPVLFASGAISLVVHTVSSLGIYCAALGVGGNSPSLVHHLVIVPLGMLVGILPLPMSGLGAFEAVMDFLYVNLPESVAIAKGQGLIVAFAYRLITVSIAIIGLFYYLASRREVAEVLHESELIAEAESEAAGDLETAAPLASSAHRPAC
jgi:hypothetical protein